MRANYAASSGRLLFLHLQNVHNELWTILD